MQPVRLARCFREAGKQMMMIAPTEGGELCAYMLFIYLFIYQGQYEMKFLHIQ